MCYARSKPGRGGSQQPLSASERDEANLECMSAPWGSGEWNSEAGFAQRLNGTLSVSLNISHDFWPVLTQNDIDLVAASLLTEENMSCILGAFSLAVDVDNV